MSSAESYRRRASEFLALARLAEERTAAAEYQRLADWYLRLAEQADRNGEFDLAIEVGSPPSRTGSNRTLGSGETD